MNKPTSITVRLPQGSVDEADHILSHWSDYSKGLPPARTTLMQRLLGLGLKEYAASGDYIPAQAPTPEQWVDNVDNLDKLWAEEGRYRSLAIAMGKRLIGSEVAQVAVEGGEVAQVKEVAQPLLPSVATDTRRKVWVFNGVKDVLVYEGDEGTVKWVGEGPRPGTGV